MLWPEEAGIGAAPASLAKAASELMRPWCDQERTSCAAAWGPTPGLVEQLRCELARERFDLACEFAFLSDQLQDASGDRAQREHASAEFWIASTVGSGRGELVQQPCARQRPQFAAQRFGCRDQQVAQLAETGPLGVDCPFACGHQGLQCLALTAGPRRRRPLLGEHAAGSADRVEGIGLSA
jgi:hypothetical protein